MNCNLAQINIARMLAPIEDPLMSHFVENLHRINTLAENSPGYVWRLKDENDNATTLRVFDDEFIIVSMSVWSNLKSLFDFTYRSDHVEIFKRKKEWFDKMAGVHMALWYVRSGVLPTPQEAKERLNHLGTYGETPYAFSFRRNFSEQEAMNYHKRI